LDSSQPTLTNAKARGSIALPLKVTGLVVATCWGLAVCNYLLRDPQPRPAQARPQAQAERPRVDPQLSSIAEEFRQRLRRNYAGDLDTFRPHEGRIYVNWSSSKCDQFDGEIIDLALSIGRTRTDFAIGLKGRRTCENTFTDFHISPDDLHDYLRGRINDSALLRRVRAGQQ
jgi:hypothetical protein